MSGLEMVAKNETEDDGSAESPTSVLEDEVCFLFPLMAFSLCFILLVLFGSREYEGKCG
jgi:hypothetical protein